MYQTNGPLVGYISFKNFKRIRYERKGEEQKGPKKVSKKIKTLAFHHLQTGNKIKFKRRKFVEQTILYKIRRFQASYDVFWPSYISSTESTREFFQFFPRTPPQENVKKKSLNLIDLSTLLAYSGHQYSMPMVISSVAILEPLWGVKG